MTSQNGQVSTWVVYFNTSDFPNLYCARKFQGASPTNDFISNLEIGPVRNWIQEQAKLQGILPTCLGRSPEDDPVIKEVWF